MKKLIMKLVSLKAALFQNGNTFMPQCNNFLSSDIIHLKEKLLSFDRQTDRKHFFIQRTEVELSSITLDEHLSGRLFSVYIMCKEALNVGLKIIMLF